MVISASEFKTNLGRYLMLAASQDIYITKNGKSIAKLTNPSVDKLALLDSLVGILPSDANVDVKEERLSRQ